MDPLGSLTTSAERQRWLDDYADACLLAEKVKDSVGSESSQLLTELGESIHALNESAARFDSNPSAYGLTESEATRRIEMLANLSNERTALMRQGKGNRRSWIQHNDSEDAHLLSADELMQQQQQRAIQAQDGDIDALGDAVVSQKQVGIAIGNEIDEQNTMLDDLGQNIHSTSVRLTRVRRRAARVSKQDRGCYCSCIIVLIIFLLIMLASTGWGCLLLFSEDTCSEK